MSYGVDPNLYLQEALLNLIGSGIGAANPQMFFDNQQTQQQQAGNNAAAAAAAAACNPESLRTQM